MNDPLEKPAWGVAGAISRLRRVGAGLVDLLLPPRCLGCGAAVAAGGGLCAACWGRLAFIDQPLCRQCGRPFDLPPLDGGGGEGDQGGGVGQAWCCAVCVARPPLFDHLRSAVIYDDASRPLLLAFKHGDRTALAPLFAAWLARAGAGVLADADLLVPVPLHRWRLWSRRYNQAALLCLALTRQVGVPTIPDLLRRRRPTAHQGGLGRRGRARNLAGAIGLGSGRVVAGRRVVLVDDVYTTGATAAACVRALRRAGAARVDVLTVARVPLSEGF